MNASNSFSYRLNISNGLFRTTIVELMRYLKLQVLLEYTRELGTIFQNVSFFGNPSRTIFKHPTTYIFQEC